MSIWPEIKKALNTSLGTPNEIALNERPVAINKLNINEYETEQYTLLNSRNYMGFEKPKIFNNSKKVYIFYAYGYSRNGYYLASYDGSIHTTIFSSGEYDEIGLRNINYINEFEDKIYVSKNGSKDISHIQNSSTILITTTLKNTPTYFCVKMPYVYYIFGFSLVKHDILSKVETTLSNYVYNNLIWDTDNYIYFVDTNYDINRIDFEANTLVNITVTYRYEKIPKNASSVTNNIGGDFIMLRNNNNVISVIDKEMKYVKNNDPNISNSYYFPLPEGHTFVSESDNKSMINGKYITIRHVTYINSSNNHYDLLTILSKPTLSSINKGILFYSLKNTRTVTIGELYKIYRNVAVKCENKKVGDIYENAIKEDGLCYIKNDNSTITVI